MKFDFSGQIFEKYSNIKFHEVPSSGRRTDTQTERRTGIHRDSKID